MGIYGLLRALSLHLVIKNFKKDFKFFNTAKNLLITQFFNGVTPFSSGGQPAQIYFLKKEGVDFSAFDQQFLRSQRNPFAQRSFQQEVGDRTHNPRNGSKQVHVAQLS